MKTEDELDIPARFNPGPGYKIEKRLGQGRWKIAFRGRAEGYTADIALICFHSAGPENVVEDLTGLLRASTGYKFRGYLPKLHRIFWDPDNRLWIQEELMKESLQSVRPLHEAGRLARIARDLSRGLTCLHEGGLVHRDIKLDNCGLDYNGTAKIFDLGSVAKMGQEGLCTITTRAPEYLSVGVGSYAEAKVIFNKSADVWALGATLYALKTGAYPFVTPDDEKKRAWLNKELVDGRLAAGAVDAQKAEMDECIRQRATAANSESRLIRSVKAHFSGAISTALQGMLAFDENSRPAAAEIAETWEGITRAFFSQSSPHEMAQATWPAIERHLESVAKGELSVTRTQLNDVAKIFEETPPQPEQLKKRIASLLERGREVVGRSVSIREAEFIYKEKLHEDSRRNNAHSSLPSGR